MHKILIVGEGRFPIYAKAVFDEFNNYPNINVHFYDWDYNVVFNRINKLQIIMARGPLINRINTKLLSILKDEKYDMVFFYNYRFMSRSILQKFKKDFNTTLFYLYSNDNPFSNKYSKFFWSKYKGLISVVDRYFYHRKDNLPKIYQYNPKNLSLLMSYYINSRNFIEDCNNFKYKVPDVVFLGHFEKDSRLEAINYLTSHGIFVGIPSQTVKFYSKSPFLVGLEKSDVNYNKYLNCAKIALIFYSSLNKDTYTRRIFEIPLTNTLMISQYTKDISKFYEIDNEIVIFKNKYELLDKVLYYLNDDSLRKKIAFRAYNKLKNSQHSVKDRVDYIYNLMIKDLKNY